MVFDWRHYRRIANSIGSLFCNVCSIESELDHTLRKQVSNYGIYTVRNTVLRDVRNGCFAVNLVASAAILDKEEAIFLREQQNKITHAP